MNRYGFETTELEGILTILKNNPQLNIESICSHLSSSNDPNKDDFSERQIKRFKEVCKNIEDSLGINVPSHVMNSNGAIRFGADSKEWVRLGIALYGGLGHPNLKQIFSLKKCNQSNKIYQKSNSVGYQNSFVALERDMQIAIIPVGYADGLNRKLGNQNGQVFIKDKACRIIGDISMDSFVADISGVKAKKDKKVLSLALNIVFQN